MSSVWLPGPSATRRCGDLVAGSAVSIKPSAVQLHFGRPERLADGEEEEQRVCHHR